MANHTMVWSPLTGMLGITSVASGLLEAALWMASVGFFMVQYYGHHRTYVECAKLGVKPATSWVNMGIVFALALVWIPCGASHPEFFYGLFMIAMRAPGVYTLGRLMYQKGINQRPTPIERGWLFWSWVALIVFSLAVSYFLRGSEEFSSRATIISSLALWGFVLAATVGQTSEILSLRGDGPSRKSWIVDSSVWASYAFSLAYTLFIGNPVMAILPAWGAVGLAEAFGLAIALRSIMVVQHLRYRFHQRCSSALLGTALPRKKISDKSEPSPGKSSWGTCPQSLEQ